MEFLINPSHDPAYNLALEELLASEYEREFLMLWRNGPSVIVGRNQNTLAEIDADAVRELGVAVVRRTTGGGAVYHDLGNFNYTIARSGRFTQLESFAESAAVVVAALKRMGIPAEFSGRNDILVDGRKVSGSARRVFEDRTLFHGTMLFDVDLSVLGRVLHPDAEKIRAKGVKSVRSRVMNLRELFPAWSVEEFREKFVAALLAEVGAEEPSPVPTGFAERAERLAAERYRTREWNYGSPYPYDFRNKARFAGGTVEVALRIAKNVIADVHLHGDFFGDAPAEELARKLVGCPFDAAAVLSRLENVKLDDYLRGVTAAELASLFE